MVSSDVGGGAGAIGDCSIGSIVWVRRRNGSWWPGKILGADELSASHVMSPRSGTPVKLLGREDASVDWYNLEKSKRVKAFRCGEFDDCIERAEATQGMPPKKREKYARREDAILHALELERQALARKYGKAGPVNRRYSKSSNGVRGELMPSEKQEIGKSLALSLMDKGKGRGRSISSKRVKDDYDFCDDDYNPGITPRMRDLGDFGPKFSPTVSNGSQKILSLDGAKTHINDSPKLEDASDDNDNLSEKRKRPHEGLGDDSLAKRRERRLPLHHVLENSSKPPSPHLDADGTGNLNLISEDESRRYNSFQHGDLEEDNMGSTEDTETDSETEDSDSDDLASLSEGAASIELQPKYPRRSSDREEQSISSEEVDELVLENEASNPGYTDPASTMGISRWQHKGKRNVRNLVKKPEGSEKSFSWVSMEEINAVETGMNGLGPQIARYGSRTTQWDWSNQYLDPSYPGRREYVGRSMFVDVEVKVQPSTGNKREHVPMISLRSKSTDQAIIGHPLQVEALESNSTDSLLVEADDWYPDMQENDAALTPTWRTARRTANVRVPRPSFTAAGDESYRTYPGSSSQRGMLMNSPIKASRKPQKKISLSGNQKTRTLSSIVPLPKKSVDPRRNVLKPEPSLPTTVACIPVKLVFSRLQEELFGRHP